MQALVEAGANQSLVNKRRKTALAMAELKKFDSIAAFLTSVASVTPAQFKAGYRTADRTNVKKPVASEEVKTQRETLRSGELRRSLRLQVRLQSPSVPLGKLRACVLR